MLKVTNPPFRILIRKLCKEVELFTELIVESTVNFASRKNIRSMLGEPENNTVVQLGGSDPQKLSKAVKILLEMGYDKFNLNCGCPSSKVQKGCFGAVLMKNPELVADIINEIEKDNDVIISLKTRIGVDNDDSFEFFNRFVSYIRDNTNCRRFYVHARKCLLKGLDPKANRKIPTLKYEYVYRIKEIYPDLFISLNGGITHTNINAVNNLDGCMIGRGAREDILIFNRILKKEINYSNVIKEYLEETFNLNYTKHKILVPLVNLYKGTRNSKKFKALINTLCNDKKIEITEIKVKINEFIKENEIK
ncbi:DUS2 [Hepatospora eriocheir]|uniref:DUS2 n=1 Tax=Hepatospora eriocheir TaxID=1081669 RepID=A0A1X0QBN9_9MICR|nr:DUS2 [Hepatospora eriocheir]